MATDRCLVSVINWRRPQNMEAVLLAYKSQSVPTFVALVECSPNTEFACPPEAAALADIIFTVNVNVGACSRFIPPLMLPEFRFCCFGVDDHLPGPRHIECLLRCAEFLDGKFATIGQDGRRITAGGEYLKKRMRPYPSTPRAADVITSSELIETKNILAATLLRNIVAKDFGDPSLVSEDDLILCFALQMAVKQDLLLPHCPSYVTPACGDDEWWALKRLPAPFALSAREDHAERRDRFIRKAMEVVGWTPQAILAEPDPYE